MREIYVGKHEDKRQNSNKKATKESMKVNIAQLCLIL